ncbi:MAG TPA: XdhC/CoxI family protein [Kineosporiaceae bacterium]|nr:XdhC/CoxI family protein [Kineosporiaceae bacterium]
MRELLDGLDRWLAEGRPVAIARVVDLEGSGPRSPGAAMAVTADGEVLGSVSGGCVEGAVVQAALDVLDSGERPVLSFGYSDDDAFAVGLTCGGTIQLFIEPLAELTVYSRLAAAIRAGVPVALATMISGPAAGSTLLVGSGADLDGTLEQPSVGSLGDSELDRVVTRDAAGELAIGSTRVRRYGPRGEARRDEVSIFIESFVPPAQMIIFGAVDFAAALSQVAKVLGYRVTLCDAREMFATRARFPFADEIVVDWPHRLLERIGSTLTPRDAICVLTHEAKFDVPAIVAALGTDVGYLGAMGSRRTHDDRIRRLRDAGVDDADLARLRSPIGLDLGALTPEETAVSICAEVIAARSGADLAVRSLRATEGPIHHRAPLVPAVSG